MALRTTRRKNLGAEGFVLPIALLFTLMIATYLGALLIRAIGHLNLSDHFEEHEDAFQLAEAGIDHALDVLYFSSIQWNDELLGADGLPGTPDDGILSFGSSVSLGSGSYEVRVVDNADESPDVPTNDVDGVIKIVSTGITGEKRREVNVHLWSLVKDNAIAAEVDIVAMEATFFGNIHANRDITVSETGVLVGNAQATATGTFNFAPGMTLVHTEGDLIGGDPRIQLPQPNVAALQASVNNLNPPGWSGGTIALSDGDVAGYDMGVDIAPNTVTVTGTATLVIFDGNSMTFLEKLGTVDLVTGECTSLLNLNILAAEGGGLTFSETLCIRGLIWAEGPIVLGEKATVQGAIISANSSVTVNEQSNITYDPDAIDSSLLAGFWDFTFLSWEEIN